MRRALVALFALISLALVPALPAAAGARPAALLAQVFPTVHGGYGSTPKLTFPAVAGPSHLESKALSVGKGPVVKSHDLIAVNYLGQIWRGKVFDSSFKRKQLFGTAIGVSQVIKGWDQSLVGAHVGSRMLLVVPPAEGYGPSGNSGAGISGSDTLVFVIDLVAAYPSTGGAQLSASGLRSSVNGLRIGGHLGGVPTVSVPNSAPVPKTLAASVVALGHGPKVKAGLVVIQYVAASWTNQTVASTWKVGEPEADVVGDINAPSYYDPLIGIPVGSRVLLEIPKTSQGGPYAVVIDVLGQPTEPKGS